MGSQSYILVPCYGDQCDAIFSEGKIDSSKFDLDFIRALLSSEPYCFSLRKEKDGVYFARAENGSAEVWVFDGSCIRYSGDEQLALAISHKLEFCVYDEDLRIVE